jgi:quinol monooxygenase YgiN
MNGVVTVTARLHVRAGAEDSFLHAAATCVAATREESGCIEYRLHRHADEAGTFIFYENWASKADLDAHARSAHLAAFRAEVEPLLVDEINIELWAEIS